MAEEPDWQIRHQGFAFLETLAGSDQGEVVQWKDLSTGLVCNGRRVPLIGPTGIWKPAVCEAPISITTAPPRAGQAPPYNDALIGDGLLRYAYRGTDPEHPDNRGLRRLMRGHVPLIYFHGVVKGEYLATWPVFVVEDLPDELFVTVDLDQRINARPLGLGLTAEEPQRRYTTGVTLHRLHQRAFRERVLRAYSKACAMCRLKHVNLLDAAHILSDRDTRSTASTNNGIALCKIHHAAFDQHIMGLRPDMVVEVRADILDEIDGPMLRHGLQEMHGRLMVVPSRVADRPSAELVEERYEAFRSA